MGVRKQIRDMLVGEVFQTGAGTTYKIIAKNYEKKRVTLKGGHEFFYYYGYHDRPFEMFLVLNNKKKEVIEWV